MRSHMDDSQRERLVSYLYDGLDDLYDQRFGFADGCSQSAPEVWLVRLLFAASIAYSGEDLEQKLLNAADSITATFRPGTSATERLDAAPRIGGGAPGEQL